MANLLEREDSPYLQQHKNNPVNWYSWCDEAFQKAKEQNHAILFPSHDTSDNWYHVMENEVFEDEKIAAYLNAHFIYDKSYLAQAVSSMDALLAKMNTEILMHCSMIDKSAKIEAFLEDYAYLGGALVSAYEVTS